MGSSTRSLDIEERNLSPAADDKDTKPLASRDGNIMYYTLLILMYWHLGGLYGLYLSITSAQRSTIIFNCVIYVLAGWGVTAGAHRLWSHRSFKAKRPLQILLMLLQSLSSQGPVIDWALAHRLHHKFCDTDADPHNSTRGFFYSHIGWMLVEQHPEMLKKEESIDLSDLTHNPVLQFQKKYYVIISRSLVFILPAIIPIIFWQETLKNSHFVSLLRLVVGSHMFYLINSAAHMFGYEPYNSNISSTQSSSLSLVAFGEGFHNYHHVFPFDYKVAELGNNYLNSSTKFIDFFSWVGWAYDLKQASDDMVMKTTERVGDGTDLWGRTKEHS